MIPRRHILRSVPAAWVISAATGCRPSKATTPSDEETGANDTSTADGDTGDGDTAVGETGMAETCVATEDDIEGPFYRANAPERDDLVAAGDSGTLLRLSGRVLAADGCSPIDGAVVDVWHADPAGAYDNTSADWRYRGRVTTSADGGWQVRTFEPGRYLNGAQYRPAHVHVKVWVEGVERLTTQLYFPDDPYNDADPWYTPALEITRTGDGHATFDLVV